MQRTKWCDYMINVRVGQLSRSAHHLSQSEGIKRDDVAAKDYDPFAWKEDAIRYSTKSIKDPIKRDLERMHEESMGPTSRSGSIPKSRNKVMLDPQFYCGATQISMSLCLFSFNQMMPWFCSRKVGVDTLRLAYATHGWRGQVAE